LPPAAYRFDTKESARTRNPANTVSHLLEAHPAVGHQVADLHVEDRTD